MSNENFIRYYDDVISEKFCDELVETFENHPELQEEMAENGHYSFTEIKLLSAPEVFNSQSDRLRKTFFSYIDRYKEDCNIKPEMFPSKMGYEDFRMKRYLPEKQDSFPSHVDVGDYFSARRFLVFFLYLTEPEGGETSFEQFGITVKPKKGRLLMFPPMWTHLHAGHIPVDKPKYIVGSYLHYV
ncbi:2OG-Fe(II) oxygenase [Methanohalobium sp.]|uniref:2OG-Fe(II) oxygenase n=1 Tax=Methanohalobium sp. TaxID=2837493 RepID=UPI0025E5B562|nr:2OG-Fe(II) oxygenase [Methanohalobium sp.]